MHAAGSAANTVQTQCKDGAADLLFGSAPRTPSYLGGTIDGTGTSNPGPRRRNGGKRPTAATGLPASSRRFPPRRSGPSQCPSDTPPGTEVRPDPLALAGRSAKRSPPATPSATSGENSLLTDLRSRIRTSAPTSLACGNPTRTSRPSTATRSLRRHYRPTCPWARPRPSHRRILLPEPPKSRRTIRWRTYATASPAGRASNMTTGPRTKRN